MEKSQDSVKSLQENLAHELYAQKSIYDSAELEYIKRIHELKSENKDFRDLNQQLSKKALKLEKLYSKLLNETSHEISTKRGENQESSRLKDEILELKNRLESSRRENDLIIVQMQKELQDKVNETREENNLLKKNIQDLLVKLQQMEHQVSNMENIENNKLDQMVMEHESEIRIWKSKVSELQTYLNSSKEKIQCLEEKLSFAGEKSRHNDIVKNSLDSSWSSNLSRGSSIETLSNLVDDEVNVLCLNNQESSKAERIQAQDRLSELLIKNYLSGNKLIRI